MSQSQTMLVSILVFDAVEALDFAGPYEVFTTATRMHARENPGQPALFDVACVSRGGTPIQARGGLRVLPDFSLATALPCDVLIVPGGVVEAAMDCFDTRDWISRTAAQASITASVCTGVFLLANSGVLQTAKVTTHWQDISSLKARFPALEVVEGRRWIDNGRLVTSAGISAGIDMSLHLVARIGSHALAERCARQMDYRWTQDDGH